MTVIRGFEELLNDPPHHYWGRRIVWELEYARRLSAVNQNTYDGLISESERFLLERFNRDSAVTEETARLMEEKLSDLGAAAKSLKILCAGHAHLDINWQWGWDETVAIVLDTFKTVLHLMKQYPLFKFSQSQAALYRIVEKYAPDMLEEIRKRVGEGRWEVTAGTWVEADKNLPNAESHVRQILYAKKYLSGLLNIDPGTLNIDFEIDTFGHSVNIPEILQKGGIRYYYFCRGYDGHDIFKWVSPSGSYVTAYRDSVFHLVIAKIEPKMAAFVPEYYAKNSIDTMLITFGVGDHGGGPVRRDIERIMDMGGWPIFPQIRFGTYGEFFSIIEKERPVLPEVRTELNPVFSGCYSSQSRIKNANRMSETCLNEAEIFGSLSSIFSGNAIDSAGLSRAWEKVLVNQFHDILPGSGSIETREHAMGQFQEAMAESENVRTRALRHMASMINTAGMVQNDIEMSESVSEGAGVGYGVSEFRVRQYEAGCGITRVFVVFNPCPYERCEAVELVVWEWKGNLSKLVFRDEAVAEHQLLDKSFNKFWDHEYIRVLVKVKVPPFGYRTYVMEENQEKQNIQYLSVRSKTENLSEYILENDYIRVKFSSKDASILSYYDKETGEEMIDGRRVAGVFRMIREDDVRRVTAWTVGRTMGVENLTENVKMESRIVDVDFRREKLRQSFGYVLKYGSSKIKVTVSLDYNSAGLNYDVECDWREIGNMDAYVPRLDYYLPVGYLCISYKYDVPGGMLSRCEKDMDMPGNSLILGERTEKCRKSMMLVTNSKYGFRGYDNSLAVTLIRSSYDPDPYPEIGIHKFRFALFAVYNTMNKNILDISYKYNHPLNFVSTTPHGGVLPPAGSFMGIESGSIVVSAIKMPENEPNGKKMIVRLYETEGNGDKVVLSFCREVSEAFFVDNNEEISAGNGGIVADDKKVSFTIMPYSLCSVCIAFK